MAILRFFAQLRLLAIATLLVMILMRLVWMDLRIYDLKVHPILKSSSYAGLTDENYCDIYIVERQAPQASQIKLELIPTWSSSWLFRVYLNMSCRNGTVSPDSYIRMNQGVLVLTILCCILICRIFCRSWLICLAVAAILLSRGRLIAANETMSGQMLSTLLVTFWLLTAFHWLRTGAKSAAILQWAALLLLLSFEVSLWPISLVAFFSLGIAYLFRGPLVKPLLARMRQTQMKERWYAQIIVPDQSKGTLSLQNKFVQNVKRLLGLVRPSEWVYQPLEQKFKTGSLVRPLQVPFLLWIHHGRRWRTLLRNNAVAGVLVCTLALLWYGMQQGFSLPADLGFTNNGWQWLRVLLSRFDLDLIVTSIIIALCLSRGPAAGLISYWEATCLLLLALLFGAVGIWLWDGLSLNYELLGTDYLQLLRAHQYVLWFEPVLLTFAVLGLYNLLRVFDRTLFQ